MDNYTHIETSDLTYHLEGQLVAVLRRLDWKTCRCAPKQLHVHVPVGVFTGSYYFFVISAIWQRNAWCACKPGVIVYPCKSEKAVCVADLLLPL